MKKGFTLVELLVVVAIIAILSVVGLTLFNNAQVNARDARRKGDIDALASALENKRTPGIVFYSPLAATDFSDSSIPQDNRTQQYCIKTYTTDDGAKVANPTTWNANADGGGSGQICPTGFSKAAVSNGFKTYVAGNGAIFYNNSGALNQKSWKVCAKLEITTTGVPGVYCKNSAQ